jgi:transposase
VKSDEEIMEILEAFDLTKSFRDAAELASCSPHTVAHYVQAREQGRLAAGPTRRDQILDEYLDKLEEWVDASHGKVRADVVHDKLRALGYTGSERTTRRGVAAAKKAYRSGHRRLYRPWVPEPGMWFQFDWCDGPSIAGMRTWLFCAWLAWSRFRVVLAVTDKTTPTLIACIDQCLRRFGGVPTYALTDNERTVSADIVARIPVRHPELVAMGRHYGLTVATCVVADPESKGGAEATVRIAEADVVPSDANLLAQYRSFSELVVACAAFCEEVNNREHRTTRRKPAEMLAEEQLHLHPLPRAPYTAVFGLTRTVGANTPVISFDGGEYSVPHRLRGEVVFVRHHGDEVIVTAVEERGAHEVARHQATTPGNPRYVDEHFGPAPEGPLNRSPRPRSDAEASFLAIGEGAALWLTEAAAVGTSRIRVKMAEAVTLGALHGLASVDEALGRAAVSGRFGEGDLASIIAHLGSEAARCSLVADESQSLQRGTSAWEGFGR